MYLTYKVKATFKRNFTTSDENLFKSQIICKLSFYGYCMTTRISWAHVKHIVGILWSYLGQIKLCSMLNQHLWVHLSKSTMLTLGRPTHPAFASSTKNVYKFINLFSLVISFLCVWWLGKRIKIHNFCLSSF